MLRKVVLGAALVALAFADTLENYSKLSRNHATCPKAQEILAKE